MLLDWLLLGVQSPQLCWRVEHNCDKTQAEHARIIDSGALSKIRNMQMPLPRKPCG